jgi:hypothetical protein
MRCGLHYVRSIPLIFSLSTSGVVRALSHTKPKYVRNLEPVFLTQFNLLILCSSFEVLTLHLQEVFIDTEQGPCLEKTYSNDFSSGTTILHFMQGELIFLYFIQLIPWIIN